MELLGQAAHSELFGAHSATMESEHHQVHSLGLPYNGKTKLKRANPVEGLRKKKAELTPLACAFFPTCLDVGWDEGFFTPLRGTRPLLCLLLSSQLPFQGLKERMCHLTAACVTAQSHAGGGWQVSPSHAAPQTSFLLEAKPRQALGSKQRASSAAPRRSCHALLLQN